MKWKTCIDCPSPCTGTRCRMCAAKHTAKIRKPSTTPRRKSERHWPRTTSFTKRMRELYGDEQ